MLLSIALLAGAAALQAPRVRPPRGGPKRLAARTDRAPARRPHDVRYGGAATSEARRHLLEERVVVDDLYYLRDADDDETGAQLDFESAKAEAAAAALAVERARVAAFIEAAVPPPPPAPWRRYGAWEWRVDGSAGGRVWSRRRAGGGGGGAEVVLDERKAPATLDSTFAGGASYDGFVVGVSDAKVAPDGETLAYTVDVRGDEIYGCEFAPRGGRPRVRNADAVVAWGSQGDIFFLRCDATGRPHEVWRSDAGGAESLAHEERDGRFRIEAPRPTADGASLLVRVASRDAGEVLEITGGLVAVAAPRVENVAVVAADKSRGVLWILKSAKGRTWLERGGESVAAGTFEALRALDGGRALVGGADARGDAAVFAVGGDGTVEAIAPPPGFAGVSLPPDAIADGSTIALEVDAPGRFARTAVYDFDDGSWSKIDGPTAAEAEISVERLDVDGIPVALATPAKSARGAVALYAYGAYGARHPTGLTGETAALLDAGVAVAVAGVRGGGERGPAWHAAGRLEAKGRSAEDVSAVAAVLRKRFPRVGARGRSAGGLSVGGACCATPALFDAVALDVPFLDALGTLQDDALPLTINEWEEFGNPHEGGAFAALEAASPLERARAGVSDFPRCLLRPALRDARTGWWESLKFAAELRENGDADVVVHADDRGHFGPASGAAYAHDVALPVAFLLDALMGDGARSVEAAETPARAFEIVADPAAAAIDAAAELRTEVFSPHLESMWSLHLQTRIYADDLEAAAYKNVALDADGGVVGVASAAAAGGRAWYATAVAAAIRRVGIGGALMDALLAAADAADVDVYLHVATDNVAALALYRSRGFEDAPPPADAALVATLEAEIEGAEKAQALLWRPRAKG